MLGKQINVMLRTLFLWIIFLSNFFVLVSCEEWEQGYNTKPGKTEVKFSYEENFIDSLDAIYCDNGQLALFGYHEIETGLDSVGNPKMKNERVIYFTYIDEETGDFSTDSTIVVVVDSTNFPNMIITKDLNILLGKVDNSHFNCTIYDAENDEWAEYENLEFLTTLPQKGNRTRTLSSDGYVGAADFLTAVGILINLGDGFKAIVDENKLNLFLSMLGIYGNFVPEEAGVVIGVATSPGILKLIPIYVYIENYIKKNLGKVRVSIEKVEVDRGDSPHCSVTYKINGLNDKGKKNAEVFLLLTKYVDIPETPDKVVEKIVLKSDNYQGVHTFYDLSEGRYFLYLTLRHKNIPMIEFTAKWSFEIHEMCLCPDEYHPHLIDLGLPDGTKWACCNVGAYAPHEFGDFYAWGETETKPYYGYENYKYDDNIVLENISATDKDVAYVKWGYEWRMPAKKEFGSLLHYTTWQWTTINGNSGMLMTGPNGNSIFLPASGTTAGGSPMDFYIDSRNEHGLYYSGNGEIDEEYDVEVATGLVFYSPYSRYSSIRGYFRASKVGGLPIRPVGNFPTGKQMINK